MDQAMINLSDVVGQAFRGEAVPVELVAADDVGDNKPARPRFAMTAYTGVPVRQSWSRHPVVIDLVGIRMSDRTPIFRDHDSSRIVGHADRIALEDGRLVASGVISGAGPDADEVTRSAGHGFPWQASVGGDILRAEFVKSDESATVNSMVLQGPAVIVRAMALKEISFVPLGADANTAATVAANRKEAAMDNIDTVEAKDVQATAQTDVDQIVRQAQQESDRRRLIQTELGTLLAERPELHEAAGKIATSAIEAGWSIEKYRLELLRVRRAAPSVGVRREEEPVSDDVIVAALCRTARLPGIEKAFDARTLELSERHYRRGLSLGELVIDAARQAGWTGRSLRSDYTGALRAAFQTTSLPGILSNTANKFLLDAYNAVESAWRSIASVRPVSDFKPVTSYRLTGDMTYDVVPPGGEIKQGKVGEESYTNQAATYGKAFSLTRQNIINDDLGAFNEVPRAIGRGAALKLNDVFWTEFLANTAFFAVANKNLVTGAGSALDIDGLTAAEQLFLDQTDPDGFPLSIMPRVLLVPNSLFARANQLMSSTTILEVGTTDRVAPTLNPHAGKFEVLRSSYLSNAKYTGQSSTAWYLIANPADLPLIEVVFLNGREAPIVESAEADFDTLGIRMRGYFDFGVKKQNPRAGVKANGA